MKQISQFLIVAAGLVTFAAQAFAANYETVPQLSNTSLEALVPKLEAVSKLTALGDCGARVARVKAGELGDQIIENVINEYMSDLEQTNGLSYDFGLLSTVDANRDRVVASFAGLAAEGSDAAVSTQLTSVGEDVFATLQPNIQMKNGTAIYKKIASDNAVLEETLTVRMLVDKTANEFVLMTVGTCQSMQ